MKKILNIKNIALIIAVTLIIVLTSTKEAKAAGTVTWSGPSSITIRETMHNIVNPIIATRTYSLYDSGMVAAASAATNYTASDTITNYQINKTAVLDFSNLTFTKPGDYHYNIYESGLTDQNNRYLSDYFDYAGEGASYRVVISVRNVVDANNTPTGNFTASCILMKRYYDEQQDQTVEEKVSPVSGTLYADYDYGPHATTFGDIEISKTVKGIGSDTTKYFPITITINADVVNSFPLDSTGWIYPISGVDSTATYNGNTVTNPTTITVGTPTTIYLKHNQTALIGHVNNNGETFDTIPYGQCNYYNSGSPKSYDNSKSFEIKKLAIIPGNNGEWQCIGSYYTIEENPGDYTATFSVNNYSVEEGYNIGYYGVNDGSNTVDFYNQKEMSPVTGLIFTILPYVIIIGIGVGGALLVMHLKNKERKVKE